MGWGLSICDSQECHASCSFMWELPGSIVKVIYLGRTVLFYSGSLDLAWECWAWQSWVLNEANFWQLRIQRNNSVVLHKKGGRGWEWRLPLRHDVHVLPLMSSWKLYVAHSLPWNVLLYEHYKCAACYSATFLWTVYIYIKWALGQQWNQD